MSSADRFLSQMRHGAGSGVPDSTFQLRLSIARTANRACVGMHRSAVDRGPAGRSASPVAKAEWRSGVALRSDRNAYEEDPSVNRRQQLDGLSSRTSRTDAKSGGVFLQLHTKQTRQLRRLGRRETVSARASGICHDGYSRGNDWRAADESHCQFQTHGGWIELRAHPRAENNPSGPTRIGPAKDHDRGRKGLHATGASHGHVRASRRIQPRLQDRYAHAPQGSARAGPSRARWTGTGVSDLCAAARLRSSFCSSAYRRAFTIRSLRPPDRAMNGGSLWKLGLSINAPLAGHSLNAFASD